MKSLNHFSIPFQGLKEGVHTYNFTIDKAFFDHFENSPIQDCNFEVQLTLDKRVDMMVLQFDSKGRFKTDCDRCMAEINLPIESSQQLLVKYSEDEREEVELIYISPSEIELNVAKFVYEFICLAIPMIKTYDCKEEPGVCNDKVVDYLNKDIDEAKNTNPIWDELNKFEEN